MRSELTRLDTSAIDARDEYERAFYEAFARTPSNRLVRQLWRWDDAGRRLATRVAYEDQDIWVVRNADGALVACVAVSVEPQQAQSAAYGFVVPRMAGVFEVLTFFTHGTFGFARIAHLWRELLTRMRATGQIEGYATCAESLLPFYRRIGWERAAQKEIEGETRCFLVLRLDREPMLGRLRRHEDACDEERRFVEALSSGGDPRLDLDPITGRNAYGCRTTPDAAETSFGSTTISLVSASAFVAARACHRSISGPDRSIDASAAQATAQVIQGSELWLTAVNELAKS